MNLVEPLVFVEDDVEDQELIRQSIEELGYSNPIRFFSSAHDALYYLMDTNEKPLLIVCDVSLPGMDGLEFRRRINQSHYLHRKSIPFIFLANSALEEHVDRGYDLMVQGYFVKPETLDGLKNVLALMLEYWTRCQHPNKPGIPRLRQGSALKTHR